MGKCCSKQENTITSRLKKIYQNNNDALLLLNNQDNTIEKIKINKQKTGQLDIDGEEKEIVSQDRSKEESYDKLILNNNSKHKELSNESSVIEKHHQIEEKKYEIKTNENSLLKLNKDYRTNDLDLKTIVDIINDKDENWEQILDDKVCKIQRKNCGDNPNPIARTTAIIEGFTSKEIFDAIAIISNRLEWDKNFNEFVSVDQNFKEGWEIFYMSLKSPIMFVSERDLIQQRKIFHPMPDSNSFLIHFKSVEHPECPVISKFVRASTIISGYFIQTIETHPPKSIICTLSQTDLGGSLPKSIVNNLASKAPKDWILNLIKGLQLLKNKQ